MHYGALTLPCHKFDFFHANKKTPPNTAMERNSGNPAPTIDIEPKRLQTIASPLSFVVFSFFHILFFLHQWCNFHYNFLFFWYL